MSGNGEGTGNPCAKASENSGGMKRWLVRGMDTQMYTCIVKAATKEEAMKKANRGEREEECWDSDGPCLTDITATDAEEVDE